MVKRVIYPPVWLLLGLIAVFMLNELYPLARFTNLAAQIFGGVLIVAGLLLLALRFLGALRVLTTGRHLLTLVHHYILRAVR